jgi:hypothetical protein
MTTDPWNVLFAIFVITLTYSMVLSISEMPDQHRPLYHKGCDKHPGTEQCRCRGNLPPPKR